MNVAPRARRARRRGPTRQVGGDLTDQILGAQEAKDGARDCLSIGQQKQVAVVSG